MKGNIYLFLSVALVSNVAALVIIRRAVPTDLHPHIQQLHVKSDIRYRFSTTVVTSKMVNPEDVARGVVFDITLPNEAFMTNFTMEIDGKVHIGEVKEKEIAKRQFEDAKSKGQSAGHISTKSRETNKFNIEVNLAAKGKVKFVLTYNELLKRKLKLYEHVTYIDPGQLIQDLQVEVAIEESRDITQLNVPPLRNDLLSKLNDLNQETNSVAVIQRPTTKSAYILYRPSLEQQKQVSEKGISGQFVVQYDVDRQQDAGDLLLVNGYFVHYFAVDNVQSLPKDVLFVLDKSGSMGGEKIKQLKEAMLNMLDDVHAGDNFNIMTFSSSMNYWKSNKMVSATTDNINDAKRFIRRIGAGGGTNINKAFTDGINMLKKNAGKGRAQVLLFLTDGQPTNGERNTDKILSNIEEVNAVSIPIFSLAFGQGADYKFVRSVAAKNNGIGRKIYEDLDANLQIQGLFKEISTVLFKNVTFHYLKGTVDENTLTKVNFNTYFKGTEILVAGRILDKGLKDFDVSIEGDSAKGKVMFDKPFDIIPNLSMNLTQNSTIGSITEKLWAYLTIKQLLEEKEATLNIGRQDQLKKKILKLSLKYKFVTPLTSMVVTLPDSNKQLEDFTDTKPHPHPHPHPPRPVPFPGPRPRPGPWFSSSRRRFSSKRIGSPVLDLSSIGRGSSLSNNMGNALGAIGPSLSNSIPRPRFPPPPFPITRPPRWTTIPTTITRPPRWTTLPTTTTTTTTVATTTKSFPLGEADKDASFVVKLPGMSDPLCIRVDATSGQNYRLIYHPDIIIENTMGGNSSYTYIAKVTTFTNGHKLEFFPNQYFIDGAAKTYTSKVFKFNEYNNKITFNVGIVALKDRLVFYMEFPTNSSQTAGLLGKYEGVKVTDSLIMTAGPSYKANIRLTKGSQYFQANGLKAIKQPLYSLVCWTVKHNDVRIV